VKKKNSLTGRSLFREVLAKGIKIQDRYIRIYVFDRNKEELNKDRNDCIDSNTTRIGITLTRHFGKAYERNKMRRRIKALYRKLLPNINGEYNIIVKPDKGFKHLPLFEEEVVITRMLVKAGILQQR